MTARFPTALLAATVLGAAAPASPAAAERSFDNPTMGIAPCVVLNRFVARQAAGESSYEARAELENICGRTVDVSFCFHYAEQAQGKAEHCVDGIIRPWSVARELSVEAPVRITAPAYRWRYLPVD